MLLMEKRSSELRKISEIAEATGFVGVLQSIGSKDVAVVTDVLEAFPLLKQTWGMGQTEVILSLGMKLGRSKSMRCISASVAVVSAILQRCGPTISQGLTSKVQLDSTTREEALGTCQKLEALVKLLGKYREQFQDLMDVEYFLGKIKERTATSPFSSP